MQITEGHRSLPVTARKLSGGATPPEGVGAMSKKHMGSSVEDFLRRRAFSGSSGESVGHWSSLSAGIE
jgi:hypothetical protein